MATSTVAGAARMARLLLVHASLLSMAFAGDATVFEVDTASDQLLASAMTLQLTSSSGVIVPFAYTVVPLTASLGLNQSEVARQVSGSVLRNWGNTA